MKLFAIARANLLRMLRDRSNIFFVFIFPIALVLLIGLQFGGSTEARVGVFDADGTPLSTDLIGRIGDQPRVAVVEHADRQDLVLAVERGTVTAGVTIPAGFADRLAAGDQAEVGFVSVPDSRGAQLRAVIEEAVADATATVAAAQFAAARTQAGFEEALATAEEIRPEVSGVGVEARSTGEAIFPDTLGRFDLGASSQLVLFMFLTGLAGSAVLIQSRQLGLSRRMLSTPTSVATVVAGEAAGRFGVVLVQGVYIMVATLLMFRVSFGDPVGAVAVLIAFGLASAGAAMLLGSLLSNDAQAAGVGVVAGLGLAALGGAMMPLDLFSPTMRAIAHVTPHAWALDAFAELVRRNGTVVDILPELGVLAAFAAVLFTVASWRLRAVITRT